MDVIKFHPAHLKDLRSEELRTLTHDQVKAIADKYPFMNPDLRIKKKGSDKYPISPATWRSFYNLIRSGHPFEIVGTKYGEPKETIEQVVASVQDISAPQFIAPEAPIFNYTDNIPTDSPARRGGRPKGAKNKPKQQ